MSSKAYFKEKVSKLIFLEFKKQGIEDIFKYKIDENIYLPILPKNIMNKVENGFKFEKIPLDLFVEGMFYVLGADYEFKYNNIYIKLLNNLEESKTYIKGKIFNYVKSEEYEDAFILLKGLSIIDESTEIYDKMLILAEDLRKKNNIFKNEELEIIEKAKKIKKYAMPYYYESIIANEDGDAEKALFCLNNYIALGGKKTKELDLFKNDLLDIRNYEIGKEIVNDDPKEALEKLIPLIDKFKENPSLYYYIAVANRNLGKFNEAIMYLNEALSIDSAIAEVVNELGINYAALGQYDLAIKYLRKVFEATKSIEVCTNLVMCYLNKGDKDMAKKHYDIAKTMDSNDEIVKELKAIFEKNN